MPRFVVLANFLGVNTPTVSDLKQPIWHQLAAKFLNTQKSALTRYYKPAVAYHQIGMYKQNDLEVHY